MVRTNFVLVDLENVQPKNIGLLYGGPFKIKVFLGATQCKIPLDMARVFQAFGPDVEYIQMDGNGTNALDFHIAYYIGRLAAEYPDAYLHIISKDTGFDPLIKHLKGQGISCQRSAAVTDMPMIKVANAESVPPERFEALLANLIKHKAAKPRTVETLRNSIKTCFANKLSDHEIQALVDQLAQRGVIRVHRERWSTSSRRELQRRRIKRPSPHILFPGPPVKERKLDPGGHDIPRSSTRRYAPIYRVVSVADGIHQVAVRSEQFYC